MTTEQSLEAVRIQLGSIYGVLHGLVLSRSGAPMPAANSASYDAYVARLTTLEQRLKSLDGGLERMKRQGPAYGGPHEDPFRAKQRERSFQVLDAVRNGSVADAGTGARQLGESGDVGSTPSARRMTLEMQQ